VSGGNSTVVRALALIVLVLSLVGLYTVAGASVGSETSATVVTVSKLDRAPDDGTVTPYVDLAATEQRQFDRLLAGDLNDAGTAITDHSFVRKNGTLYDVQTGVVDSGAGTHAVLSFAVALLCSLTAVGSASALVTGEVREESGPVLLAEGLFAFALAVVVLDAPL
jgi:hypothetical protein